MNVTSKKKVLDIGIPQFSPSNTLMNDISSDAEDLSKKIKKSIASFNKIKNLGKKRNNIREHFKKEFAEIDKLVMKLFK